VTTQTHNQPERYEVTPDGLYIRWKDGLESLMPHRYVRGHCGCAQCVDEITRERKVGVDDVASDVTIEDALEVGRYAIALLFSDLHETGIYPFRYLRELATSGEV
jgi:ATP-binding protein involved in chromosome partitioning